MWTRTVIISGLLAALCASEVRADDLVEVQQKAALLLLGSPRQSVTLSYDTTYVTPGSHSQRFTQRYTLDEDVAVLDPDLLLISFEGAADLTQTSDSSRSGFDQGENFSYSLTGTGFRDRPYPVNFASQHTTSLFTAPYLPTFETTVDVNQVGLRMLNKTLPVDLRYSNTAQKTTGLGPTSSYSSNALSLGALNEYRRSTTSFTASFMDSTSSAQNGASSVTKSYSLSLTNGLTLDEAGHYTLSGTLQTGGTRSGDIPQNNLGFSEALSCAFGKALTGSASYDYSDNKTIGLDNANQEFEAHSFQASLSHTLFRSLFTSLSSQYRLTDALGGSETSLSRTVSLTYNKLLPAESSFSLGFADSVADVDRTFPAPHFFQREEKHQVQFDHGQWQVILLNYPIEVDGTQGVPDVKVEFSHDDNAGNSDSVVAGLPNAVFKQGTDYIIEDASPGHIKILFSGNVPRPADSGSIILRISYEAHLAVASYTMDARSYNGSLSLFQNRYHLTATFTTLHFDVHSGTPSDFTLSDTTSLTVRGDARFGAHLLNLEYGKTDGRTTRTEHYTGGWVYTYSVPGGGLLGLSAYDTYMTSLAVVGTGSSSLSSNDLSAGASFGDSLLSWASYALSLNYTNSSGNVTANSVYFRTTITARFSQTSMSLSGQTLWRSIGSQSTLASSAHVDLTRKF